MGATALIPATSVTPDQLPLLMKRHDATIFAAAPGVFRKFVTPGKTLDLPKLRHGLTAGEKLSATIDAHWREATGTPLFEAYGMSERQVTRRILIPQMWTYALPGLSNLWMILIKATPLLFLLGVEDIVYWARELGGSKTSTYAYPHGDWRVWYFLALLVFYLGLTRVSEIVLDRPKANAIDRAPVTAPPPPVATPLPSSPRTVGRKLSDWCAVFGMRAKASKASSR